METAEENALPEISKKLPIAINHFIQYAKKLSKALSLSTWLSTTELWKLWQCVRERKKVPKIKSSKVWKNYLSNFNFISFSQHRNTFTDVKIAHRRAIMDRLKPLSQIVLDWINLNLDAKSSDDVDFSAMSRKT